MKRGPNNATEKKHPGDGFWMVTPPSKDTRKRNNHKDGKPNVASDEGWKVCGEEVHFPSAHSLAPRGAREPARGRRTRDHDWARDRHALSQLPPAFDDTGGRHECCVRIRLRLGFSRSHERSSRQSILLLQMIRASYPKLYTNARERIFRPPHAFVHPVTKPNDIARASPSHI